MKLERPKVASQRYVVIDHQEAITALTQRMQGLLKLKPGRHSVALTVNHAEMLATVSEEDGPRWVGLVNSNTKRRPSAVYAGVEYKGACLCLDKGGEYRHDGRYNWEAEMDAAVKALKKPIKKFQEDLDWLKVKEITPRQGDSLIMDAMRAGLLSNQNLKAIEESRKCPPDTELEEPTALSLIHAFSRGLAKGKVIITNPNTDLFARTLQFYRIVKTAG